MNGFPIQRRTLAQVEKRPKNPNDSRVRKGPRTADPLVRALYDEMIRLQATYAEIAKVSGVSPETLRNDWKDGTNPSLSNFRAVAEALGFSLVLRRTGLPKV